MKTARLSTADGPVEGVYEDGVVHGNDGSYECGLDGRLLPPCDPSAIYCVGRNYVQAIEEKGYDLPEEPSFFLKPPTALLAHGRHIRYPHFTEELTYAGELAAVIDDRCRNLPRGEVDDHVRGYTIMNDLDALDQQGRTARKAFDGSAPLGPWIETDILPDDVEMWTDISGERHQSSNTDDMLFSPRQVIAYLSRRFTFEPGDVVAFGSPGNPGVLEPGDTISITYDGVGTLRNSVVEGECTDDEGVRPA